MAGKKDQKELDRVKEKVRDFHDYFLDNYKRFNKMRRFIFESAVSEQEKSVLDLTGKPNIEANVIEAYMSRLLGEFSKQEPSIIVSADYNSQVDPEVISLVGGVIRHNIDEANRDNFEYEIYRDMLSGGWSVAKIWTDYVDNMSFDQKFCLRRVFDPTLCGFDPLARASHKGDGDYCYELYPRRRTELEKDGIDTTKMGFIGGNEEGFNWSYRNNREEIAILCDFYEKKKKRIQIVQISDNPRTGPSHVVTMDEYKKIIKWWEENQFIEQPPIIIGKPRYTVKECIVRTVFCDTQIISVTETDFKYLPLVFFDGNSVILKDSDNSVTQQLCRSYFYQAIGTQKLKNFAMQCLANELENMVQHKFMVAQEALPDADQYLQAWKNFQIPSNMVWKSVNSERPDVPNPPPQPVPRIPVPPEVTNAYMGADQTIQNILGSYDASLGINNNQLSGVAIVEAATQSNAAAMPFIVGFLQGLNQLAIIQVDLIPKYLKTSRTIPVIEEDGRKSFRMINPQNGQPGTNVKYKENALQVRIEPGVNFSVQRSRSLEAIVSLSQAIPTFGEFINAKCLPIILDDLEIHGSDQMKKLAEQWGQEMEEAKKAAQQQPNPEMIKAQLMQKELELKQQELQLKAMKQQSDEQIAAAKAGVEQMKEETARMELIAKIGDSAAEHDLKRTQYESENLHSATDLAIKAAGEHSKHTHNLIKLQHEIEQGLRESTESKT
jgi:hypothetical protein